MLRYVLLVLFLLIGVNMNTAFAEISCDIPGNIIIFDTDGNAHCVTLEFALSGFPLYPEDY